jgi:hypothetical protein
MQQDAEIENYFVYLLTYYIAWLQGTYFFPQNWYIYNQDAAYKQFIKKEKYHWIVEIW